MAPASIYRFGAFELRSFPRPTLLRGGKPIPLTDRHLAVLTLLLSHAGHVVSRDAVMTAGWHDVSVSPNSVDRIISDLRRVVDRKDGARIEAIRRRGYRLDGTVTHEEWADGSSVDAQLAPLRRWIEGRAALEGLTVAQARLALEVFEQAVAAAPQHGPALVGLANALLILFEATRADAEPDRASLARALRLAQTACERYPDYAEAWATLAVVLSRAGRGADAVTAATHATMLEPDNCVHRLRLAMVTWGRTRLGAARRVLSTVSGFPLAHLLASTVFIALQSLDEAEREVAAGIAGYEQQLAVGSFSGVALHWAQGLLHFTRGDVELASAAFARELSFESRDHIYGRETCALTSHAFGAMGLHAGDAAGAATAFEASLGRVAGYPLAHAGLRIARYRLGASSSLNPDSLPDEGPAIDVAMARGALLREAGNLSRAVACVTEALTASQNPSAGWILPIEPLLSVSRDPGPWRDALAIVKGRAV